MNEPLQPTARARAALALVGCALLAACGGESASGKGSDRATATLDRSWSPQTLTEIGDVPVRAVRGGIQRRLGAAPPAPLGEDQWRHVRSLYRRYGQGPLWFGESGLLDDRAAALLEAVAGAHTDALRLDVYPLRELARALVAVREAKTLDAERIAAADVLLTSTYAALGEDLLTGQVDPRSVSDAWHIDPQEEEVDNALARVLRDQPLDRSIARMRPRDEDYGALRRELQRYRQLAARGWALVPEGKALEPGQADAPARLAALRRRLQAEGLLQDSAGAGVYDARLAGAVAEYQARHAIVADSVLGPETVASLNTPPAYRLGQIAANLERLRWLPRSLGSRYIMVNVPAFRLEAFEGGSKVLEMKVIVGSDFEDRATPVFSDSMEYVVFRPYWFVTDSIAAKELLPKASADPGYLAQNDYEVFQENGKTRIRQRPGPENSLGLVKFIFPNDFNIYLHDTPEDRLFQEDVRAFSHGCIRLEKPEQLARFVLGWPEERIRQAMREGPDDRRVDLPRRIPVYIAYLTAYTRNGRLHFGNDLYRRDDPLIRATAGGALPDAQALKALETLRRALAK